MKIDRYADFDCRPETLLAMLTDRDCFACKHAYLDATHIRMLDHAGDGDRFVIEVHQRVPRDRPVPGFINKPVGGRVSLTQSSVWRRADRVGRLVVELDAATVIGGRIERFPADEAVGRVEADLDESRRLLAQFAA